MKNEDWGADLVAGLLISPEAWRNKNMRQKFFVYKDRPQVDLFEFLVAAGRPVTLYRAHDEGVEFEMDIKPDSLDRVANKAASRGLVFGGIAQLTQQPVIQLHVEASAAEDEQEEPKPARKRPAKAKEEPGE